ncbi:hypothetical protein [Gimesia aquarii]|uniref:DUF4157 domain-containing protein n=1 Tax=Gimesia aquarii TaxID=2527964 RepID=A0A517VYE3_9PLAN|nr:hypothetical protein [Gimesia aquarii]QDT98026.1 hypothetical protein V144x_35100 [Gimesia aquarii]
MRYVLIFLFLSVPITTNAQLIRIKPPRIPTKPPTANDFQRELENAGREIKDVWEKIRNLNPPNASEELWGEAGRVAYVTAAKIMAKRSSTGEALPANIKHKLRPFYDDLVDRVTVHWGTPTLDEWAAAKFKVRLTDTESDAQTYGYDIYTRWQKGEHSDEDVCDLMSHELMHSRQYERFRKSLSNFGYQYFKEYKRSNQNYRNNKLEVEAYEKAPHCVSLGVTKSDGYVEFHRRLVQSWQNPVAVGRPAIIELQFPRGSIKNQLQPIRGRSIEAKWIGYLIHHIVGNPPNEKGYKEFHRRLKNVWKEKPPIGNSAIKELKFPEGSLAEQLKDIPGRSNEAKWIGFIFHHVVGNPPNEEGYKEFHRRLLQVWKNLPPCGPKAIIDLQFPEGSIENQLKPIPGRTIEEKWIGYFIHHIVGNHAELK